MSMFGEMFNQIISAVSAVSGKVGNTVSATVIGLSFIMSLIRVAYQAYEKGLDQWSVYAKKQTMLFLIVVGLCVQLPFFPHNQSFITGFPGIIIRAGFTGAQTSFNESGLTATNYGDSITAKLREASGNQDGDKFSGQVGNLFQQCGKAIQGQLDLAWKSGGGLIPGAGELMQTMKVLIVTAAVFIPIALMTLPLFMIHAVLGILMLLVAFLVCITVASAFVIPNADMSAVKGVFGAIQQFIGMVMNELGLFMFSTALTFGFMGTMISLIIKSVIFCVTFPISIVNMAFEKQITVFIQNVVKIFSLAITPFIMGAVFQVLVAAYGAVCARGGVFDTIVTSYLWSNINSANMQGGTLDACLEMYALLFRFFVAAFLAPSILVIPAITVLFQSHKIAGELLGSAVGYSTGLSQRFMKSGGVPGMH